MMKKKHFFILKTSYSINSFVINFDFNVLLELKFDSILLKMCEDKSIGNGVIGRDGKIVVV